MKIPAVQDWAAQKVARYLENKIDSKVEIGDVTIDLFKHLVLNDVYVEDKHQDTLLFVKHFEVNLGAINPFAPRVKIKNVALDGGYINISRNAPDTIFNYQFILDVFATSKKDTSASQPMDINLQRLKINSTRFQLHDELAHNAFNFYLHETDAKVNELNLIDHVLALESFELNQAVINIIQLADLLPETINITDVSEDSVVHISAGDWTIEAIQLNLRDCKFTFDNENKKAINRGIDFNHLALSNINIDLSEITFVGDSVQGSMNEISLHEKSGFTVNKLRSSFLFSAYEITLNDLFLQTPRSTIGEKFSMQYNSLNDFSDFEQKIVMQANLKQAVVDAKDIAFFAPVLQKYDAVVKVSADVHGTLENLKAKNLQATLNDIGGIDGEISMNGLPVIDETFITLKMKPLHADMQKLNTLAGGGIPQNILELGNVNYQGNFTGFIYDFVLLGDVQTSAGNAFTDVNFKYDKPTKTSAIDGHITTETLNIGKLIGDEKLLGEVSANAKVKGIIRDNKVIGNVEATVNTIFLNGYSYQNITVNGEVHDKLFDGKIKINDPNLKQDFSGKIDLNSEIPTYDFVSTIHYANPGKLKFYNKDIEVSFNSNLNVKGHSLDDIIGNAVLSDVMIKDENTTYKLKSFTINAGGDSLNKNLSIRSDLLDADFNGNYSFAKLPLAIQDMINIYVKGGQLSSEEIQNAQNVDYTVQVKDAKTLTQIFYPDINEIKNLKVEGDLNTLSKKFFSRATAEKLTYNGIDFNNSAFEIYTKNNKLNFFTQVKEIALTDSLFISSAVLEGDFSQDSLNFNLKAGRDTDPERLNLYAGAFINDSIIRLNVLPSEIFLNNDRWEIQPNNSLKYDYKNLIAENFILQHENKSIGLTSIPDKTFGNILKFQLKNILIEDITELINYKTRSLSGVINANVNMSSNFSELNFVGSGNISTLVLNGELLGDADVTATILYPNQRINFNVMLKGENKLRAYGYYKTGGDDSIVVDAQITKIPLSVAAPFTKGLFSEMEGYVSGEIAVRGTLQKPVTSGFAEIKKGGLQVDYLGTNYFFPYLKLNITSDKISIVQNTLTDKFQNEGTITGSVSHKNYHDFYFDNITITSNKLLFMETTREQNPDFWGTAIGKANVVINGPIENLNINVNARPLKDAQVETVVYLPTFGSGNVARHNFINFVNRSDTIQAEEKQNAVSVVNFDMFLAINQDAKVIILLNSEETDVLEAKGTGTLHIEANTIDKLDMNGTITVTEGSYNFSFENFFTKKFTLKPGGTIEFERDPYKAELNLTAIYKAQKVKQSSLTGVVAGENANATTDIDVLIQITGPLESPEINFDLLVPGKYTVSLSAFDQKLSQVLQDKNELNKQVFALLWANQFINSESGNITQTSTLPSPLQSGVNSTMSEFFTNQLSSLFTDWISEIFPNAELDIGYKKIESGQLGSELDQRQLFDIALQQKLFNDAITVRIGGTYDYTQSASTSSNLAGDFELEYKITPDGRIRVKAFRRSEYDEIGAKNDNKTGLGLFYTKDFDTLGELFGKKEDEVVIQ